MIFVKPRLVKMYRIRQTCASGGPLPLCLSDWSGLIWRCLTKDMLQADFMLEEPIIKLAHPVRARKLKAFIVGTGTNNHPLRSAAEISLHCCLAGLLQVLRCVARYVFPIYKVLPFQLLTVKYAVCLCGNFVCLRHGVLAVSELDRLAQNFFCGTG